MRCDDEAAWSAWPRPQPSWPARPAPSATTSSRSTSSQAEAQAYEQQQALPHAAAQAPAPAAAAGGRRSDRAQLQKLADLHTQGILSDEEFAAAKAKALGI